eukprot:4648965-Pleurochrysis_carterae.AAC.1
MFVWISCRTHGMMRGRIHHSRFRVRLLQRVEVLADTQEGVEGGDDGHQNDGDERADSVRDGVEAL